MPLPEGNAFVYACVLYVSAIKLGDLYTASEALKLADDEYENMGYQKVIKLRRELKESIVSDEPE